MSQARSSPTGDPGDPDYPGDPGDPDYPDDPGHTGAPGRTAADERGAGWPVAGAGGALLLVSVAFDLALSGELTLFFDLCFVVACLALALAVRPHDVFSGGVLPPLAMLVGFVVLAAAEPGALADPRDGVVQATVTGLAHHSGALAGGYALCLATLAVRRRRADLAGGPAAQASKRAPSPAP